MSDKSKILISILILALVLLAIKFFKHGPFAQEVCPPDHCQVYKNISDSKPASLAFAQEEGRVRDDFFPALPPGLPENMPIDANPLQVLNSYAETIEDKEQDTKHIQITYQYITSQKATTAKQNFENYLNKNGFKPTVTKQNFDLLTYTLFGHKIVGDKASKQFDQSVTVSIATRNQFESNVSISAIISDIIPVA